MGRTYAEWEGTQDKAMVAKVRAGDEANKVLLNQINWMWVANLMAKKTRTKSFIRRTIGLGNIWPNRCNEKVISLHSYSFCFYFLNYSRSFHNAVNDLLHGLNSEI